MSTTPLPGWGARLILVLALAMIVLGAAPAIQPPLQAESNYPGLDSPDPAVRAKAVQAIRAAEDAAAVPALLAMIEDADPQVGLYVAQALVELAPWPSLVSLNAPLWGKSTDGRWRAAYVLGERKRGWAVSRLTCLLRDDEVLVARTAAEALARIGTPGAIDGLIQSLWSQRPSEEHAAKWGLLSLGDAAVPALSEALESGDMSVEQRAATVLEAIGTPDALAAVRYAPAE